MSARELRASFSLASIFGLRLFGMFIILPVFALYAERLPGWNLTLVGIALGAYGLTQAMLQIPFGWVSDRLGRKPAWWAWPRSRRQRDLRLAEAPWAVIRTRRAGRRRYLGVAIAMAADLTRPSQRTKSMAIIGSTIGVSFALSFVVAPVLQRAIGVPGIFALTGVLALAAIAIVAWVSAPRGRMRGAVPFAQVPDPELRSTSASSRHAILMALFRGRAPAVGRLRRTGCTRAVGSFVLMPFVAVAHCPHESCLPRSVASRRPACVLRQPTGWAAGHRSCHLFAAFNV
jgi:MFS family permease